MDFKLSFNMDNAAFGECPEIEVKRILEDISTRVVDGAAFGPVYDYNGNNIGVWSIAFD